MERRALLGALALAGGSMLVSGTVVGHEEDNDRAAEEDRWRSSVGEGMSTGTLPIRWSASSSSGLRAALTFDDGPTLQFTPGLRGSHCIEKVVGTRPRWLRPPRGEVTTATLTAAREAGLEIALWSVNRGNDPDGDSAGVAAHLATSLRPGSIVGLHDGIGRSSWVGRPDPQLIRRHRAELDALPIALSEWRDQGYGFEALSELIPPAR